MTHHETPGLNATQAAEREQQVRHWLMRIYILCQISGCSVRFAIAAIEHADQAQPSAK